MRLLCLPSRATALSPSLCAGVFGVLLLTGLLTACGQDGPPPPPPLREEALAAVVSDPGVPREPLARAVDDLFTNDEAGETRALIVMHQGKIVAERYGEGYAAETPLTGWSMSKSVTGALIGIMIADGRLRLDDPAPIARWQRAGDPRGGITLRHLLQMRSGLRHTEGAEPAYESGEVQMLFLEGRDDMAAWAEVQPPAAAPGTQFAYSTPTSMILSGIATDLLAPEGSPANRQRAMAEFLQTRLADPLGMTSMRGEYDAAGTLVGGSMIWANARDWGRFGEFLRNGGSVKGAQIVPRSWVTFMTSSSPAAPDYGGQLWLNKPSKVASRDVLFADRGPDDAFAAVGHLGQYVIVAPGAGLTIVRLGKTDDEGRAALVDELADIVELYAPR